MRAWGPLLALSVLLVGCQSANSPPVAEEPVTPAVQELGPALYQPTIHALFAFQGGTGTRQAAGPLITEWRRDGDDMVIKLTLLPDRPIVRVLKPGRYTLVSAAGEDGRIYVAPDGPGPRLRSFVLEPGDVLYGGSILMRGAGEGGTRIDIVPRNAEARDAVGLEFPQQLPRLRTRLFQVVK